MAPITALIAVVMGGIYAGWFTPTESGAVGALGAFILALARGKLNRSKLWDVLLETGHVTVAILFLIISANIYSRMLALSGLTHFVGTWIGESGLGVNGFLLIYLFVILLLGTILDSSSIMMIMVPLVYPIVKAMGIDFVWFGLVTVLVIEIGLITPPFGIAVFVVKATLDDQRVGLNEVFAGAFPFVILMVLVLALVIVFPQIPLVLVR
jgi:tripartite ATP-independent transporter DctM subunit